MISCDVDATALTKQIETADNHDVERTPFHVIDHERRAKIAFSSGALDTDRSWSSAVSHDRPASYPHHDSRPSQFVLAKAVDAQK